MHSRHRTLTRTLIGAGLGAVLAVTTPSFGQAPDVVKGVIDEISFKGGTLESFVETIKAEVAPQPINVIFRNQTGLAEIPQVRLRNVEVSTAIESALHGSGLRLAMLQGKRDTPVFVISGAHVEAAAEPGAQRWTEVFSVAEMVDETAVDTSVGIDSLVSAIDTAVGDDTTAVSPPDLKFHEPSGLLIVTGSPGQIQTIRSVVEQMAQDSATQRQRAYDFAAQKIDAQLSLKQLETEMQTAEMRHQLMSDRYDEIQQLHAAGAVSSTEVGEVELNMVEVRGRLEMIHTQLDAARAQYDLLKQLEASKKGAKQIECEYRVQARGDLDDAIVSVIHAVEALNGPKIKVINLQSGRSGTTVAVAATNAQQKVIEAAIAAMNAVANPE